MRVELEDQASVERVTRYIMRPPTSLERMAWDGAGKVRYRRKRGHEGSGFGEREVEAFCPGTRSPDRRFLPFWRPLGECEPILGPE